MFRQKRYFALWLIILLGAVVEAACALEPAKVLLLGLPQGAKVYINGKARTPQQGVLALPVGEFEVQVEAKTKQELLVFWRRVSLAPGQVLSLKVRLLPLAFPMWTADGKEALFLLGQMGEAGAQGDASPPFHPLPVEEEAQIALLKSALESLLVEMEAQAEAVERGRKYVSPDCYVYALNPHLAVELGAMGELGQKGTKGLAGEVFLLQDAKGSRLLDTLAEALGISLLEQQSRILLARVKTPPRTVRVSLYTSSWRKEIEKAHKERRQIAKTLGIRDAPILRERPDILGEAGPPGERGTAGVPPPDATPVRFSEAQTQRLKARFQSDVGLQATLKRLRERLERARIAIFEEAPTP